MNDKNDPTELLGEEYDDALYCIDCGQLLSRSDDKCTACGAFQ